MAARWPERQYLTQPDTDVAKVGQSGRQEPRSGECRLEGLLRLVADSCILEREVHRNRGGTQSMRHLSKMSLLCSILVGPLTAYAAVAKECLNVNAIGNPKDIVNCPADQEFDYCFVRSNISDRSGLLTGKLEFFENFDQGTKHPSLASGNLYTAELKITTEQGTLELTEHGIMDMESKEFAGLATITDASGDLAKFSGTISDVGNSEGTALLSGTICRD